jgi:hypothetical protein
MAPENMCQYLQGVLPGRFGKIEVVHPLQQLSGSFTPGLGLSGNIEGLAFYGSDDGTHDYLIVFRVGAYTYSGQTYRSTSAYCHQITWSVTKEHGVTVGKATLGNATILNHFYYYARPIRTVQFGKELIICGGQDDYLVNSVYVGQAPPTRIYYETDVTNPKGAGLHWFTCGAQAILNSTLAVSYVSSGVLTGTYQYALVEVDEFGRVGDTIDAAGVAWKSATPSAQKVKLDWVEDVRDAAFGFTGSLGHTYTRIFRKNPGGSVGYKVADVARGTVTYTDNTADSAIAGNAVADPDGYNSPPIRGSVCTVWKNRLILNTDVEWPPSDPRSIQISNEGSSVQFSVLAVPDRKSSGLNLQVSDQTGDNVCGFINYGSVLGLLKGESYSQLFGDNADDFVLRPIHKRGSRSPDSIVVSDEGCYYTSSVGVVRLTGDGGFAPEHMTHEIEDDLFAWQKSTSYGDVTMPPGAINNACAATWDHRVYVNLGNKTWVFDEISHGWADTGYGIVANMTVCNTWDSANSRHGPKIVVLLQKANTASAIFDTIYYFETDTTYVSGSAPYAHLNPPARIVTRCYDGSGLPRSSEKRLLRFKAWGEYHGDDTGTWPQIGTVVLHSETTASAPFPIYPPDNYLKQQGLLIQQDMGAGVTGGLLWAEIEFTDPRFTLRDTQMEYVRLS